MNSIEKLDKLHILETMLFELQNEGIISDKAYGYSIERVKTEKLNTFFALAQELELTDLHSICDLKSLPGHKI